MNITLNIGLEVSKYYLPEGVAGMQLTYSYVEEYLNKNLGKPSCIGMAQSNTEQTIVVQYSDTADILPKLFWIAHGLQQDCIAYAVTEDDTAIGGALVGKYAHEWNYGIFNEEYFIPATINLQYRIGLPL